MQRCPDTTLRGSAPHVRCTTAFAALQVMRGGAAFWGAAAPRRAMAQLYLRLVELARLPPLDEPLDPEVHVQARGCTAAAVVLLAWRAGSLQGACLQQPLGGSWASMPSARLAAGVRLGCGGGGQFLVLWAGP